MSKSRPVSAGKVLHSSIETQILVKKEDKQDKHLDAVLRRLIRAIRLSSIFPHKKTRIWSSMIASDYALSGSKISRFFDGSESLNVSDAIFDSNNLNVFND